MFGLLKKLNPLNLLIGLGLKKVKHWVDDTFRDKVQPVEGSVLYCDLYMAVEHSGIYVGDNNISNIVVDGFADAAVKLSNPKSFTDSSKLHKHIYVSCKGSRAVGDDDVAYLANKSVGDRNFYGLVFSNCHQFSERCVNEAERYIDNPLFSFDILSGTWEPTLNALKSAAKNKLGATKWRLWDWQGKAEPEPKPDFNDLFNTLTNTPLTDENASEINKAKLQLQEYLAEIADEAIPQEVISTLNGYAVKLSDVQEKYQECKGFMAQMGEHLSYNELNKVDRTDFLALAKLLEDNNEINKIIQKLGRNYISEEKKEKVTKCAKNEMFGIHKSNELVRVLPSELINLEDDDLEYLFYAKLLENSLLTYELSGDLIKTEEIKNKGPIIACLDTSGSMKGTPLLKAKALLLAVSKILEPENRELYVLLFGANNEISELNLNNSTTDANTNSSNTAALLSFLSKGYGGGTDFETPLNRSVQIIEKNTTFINADILMITDGYCSVTPDFKNQFTHKKQQLDFSVYTVICDAPKEVDDFSDEIFSL